MALLSEVAGTATAWHLAHPSCCWGTLLESWGTLPEAQGALPKTQGTLPEKRRPSGALPEAQGGIAREDGGHCQCPEQQPPGLTALWRAGLGAGGARWGSGAC